MTTQKVIAVYGSAAPMPGTHAYAAAYDLGVMLAERGFAVLNGGYSGVMHAVSAGAQSAGGRVIGVTSNQIERFRNFGPNPHISEEVRYETLRDRLMHVVTNNDGAIVMPGGIGTLAELAVIWNLVQVGDLSPRPLIVVGAGWEAVVATLLREQADYIRDGHAGLLSYAPDVAAAINQLCAALNC